MLTIIKYQQEDNQNGEAYNLYETQLWEQYVFTHFLKDRA